MLYQYCTTEGSVCDAVVELKRSPYLILDTEGRDIGTLDGALSIIAVGTSDASHIFLFDVVALSQTGDSADVMQPLLDLLIDPTLVKVMWDARQDYVELKETFGCNLVNVLDLQIAELVSRWTDRGEGEKERIVRIQKGFFGFAPVRNNPKVFEGLHVVSGMQRCVEEVGIDTAGKDPIVKNLYKQFGSDVWMNRPLTQTLRDYAAKDIELIAKLYARFTTLGWISDERELYIVECSQRYMETRGTAGRDEGDRSNYFQQNALVLGTVFDGSSSTGAAKARCHKCLQLLPQEASYSTKRNRGRVTRCLTCRRCARIAVKFEVEKPKWDLWV